MFGSTYNFEDSPALLGAQLSPLLLYDLLGPLDGLPLDPLVLLEVQPIALV